MSLSLPHLSRWGVEGAARVAYVCVYECVCSFCQHRIVSVLSFSERRLCHALFVAFKCAYIFQLDAAAAKRHAATLRDERWQPQEGPAHVHPLSPSHRLSFPLSLQASFRSPAKVKMKFLWRALVFDVSLPSPPLPSYPSPPADWIFVLIQYNQKQIYAEKLW